ncbi:hypothetical protein [Actinoalloteichus hymeniacidonis]|uniref:DUF2188 domain-containing protein n=1 Tax=Actinoalloteichus hymeniacidonis TaxID=340345 RepID=A0AAC9HMT5_9PSEU|nr:hypothetical protein [Actinoalloteichus hymeniacidonis]AOS62247.1 hypothetical protein TL08_07140 [Actinoalloteichus hymeniacidonis]MBB5909727.1 hypothetical protein [Actinoalloteichus hymeniacidonis]
MRKASQQADGAQPASHLVAEYTVDGDEWTVTVSDGTHIRTARADDLVTARESADRLAGELRTGGEHPTVVHLLDGDALAFTSAYLTARHVTPRASRPNEPETTTSPTTASPTDEAAQDEASNAESPLSNTTAEKGAAATGSKKKSSSRRRRGARTVAMTTETSEEDADSGAKSTDDERPEADSA